LGGLCWLLWSLGRDGVQSDGWLFSHRLELHSGAGLCLTFLTLNPHQACTHPARDIFTRASEVVSSLVVIPLLASDPSVGALGALYFAHDSPCEFEHIQDVLLVRWLLVCWLLVL